MVRELRSCKSCGAARKKRRKCLTHGLHRRQQSRVGGNSPRGPSLSGSLPSPEPHLVALHLLKKKAGGATKCISIQLIQSLSCVRLLVTPWTAAHQASLSITHCQSLLKIMAIESVMPSNHLIVCCPLLLLPSTFPSIRVFSDESVLHIRWPKYWSFSFSISPTNEYSGLISFRMDWLDLQLQSKGPSRVFSNTTV